MSDQPITFVLHLDGSVWVHYDNKELIRFDECDTHDYSRAIAFIKGMCAGRSNMCPYEYEDWDVEVYKEARVAE